MLKVSLQGVNPSIEQLQMKNYFSVNYLIQITPPLDFRNSIILL